jgi:predicted ATP-dependent serine protease
MTCKICGREYTPGRTMGRCNDCDEWARAVRYMLTARRRMRLVQHVWDMRDTIARLGGRYELGARIHARALQTAATL